MRYVIRVVVYSVFNVLRVVDAYEHSMPRFVTVFHSLSCASEPRAPRHHVLNFDAANAQPSREFFQERLCEPAAVMPDVESRRFTMRRRRQNRCARRSVSFFRVMSAVC